MSVRYFWICVAIGLLALFSFAAHAECLPSKEAVWSHHPGAWASWSRRVPGHKDEKCYFASERHSHKEVARIPLPRANPNPAPIVEAEPKTEMVGSALPPAPVVTVPVVVVPGGLQSYLEAEMQAFQIARSDEATEDRLYLRGWDYWLRENGPWPTASLAPSRGSQ